MLDKYIIIEDHGSIKYILDPSNQRQFKYQHISFHNISEKEAQKRIRRFEKSFDLKSKNTVNFESHPIQKEPSNQG